MEKYGTLTFIQELNERNKHGSIMWKCLCDCGKEHIAPRSEIKHGRIKSCGCSWVLPTPQRGQMFGRLTYIIKLDERGTHGEIMCLCYCSCGNTCKKSHKKLYAGLRSCGCLLKDIHSTHRGSKTREYICWKSMRARCNNKNNLHYKDYGGRGIGIHPSWNNYKQFLIDVGQAPTPEHSLDRWPNNNGNYEPGNVRWANKTEQARNTRTNRMLTMNGTTKCLAEWASEYGILPSTIYHRLKRGLSLEDALTIPLR